MKSLFSEKSFSFRHKQASGSVSACQKTLIYPLFWRSIGQNCHNKQKCCRFYAFFMYFRSVAPKSRKYCTFLLMESLYKVQVRYLSRSKSHELSNYRGSLDDRVSLNSKKKLQMTQSYFKVGGTGQNQAQNHCFYANLNRLFDSKT